MTTSFTPYNLHNSTHASWEFWNDWIWDIIILSR
jgi:hypothetical protein